MTESTRMRPHATREGHTRKLTIGPVTAYITANKGPDGKLIEVFAKADEGYQGQLDSLCIVISLALQHGTPAETIIRHLRYRRYPPEGGPGQPVSLADALGLAMERENGTQ